MIGFAGFSQSNKNAASQKRAVKVVTYKTKKVEAEGTSHSNINWRPTQFPQSSSTSCVWHISDSWNPNGVGAGADCVQQNCLSYNKDLNAVSWMMRGSCDWTAAFPTSGGYEASIVYNANPNTAHTYSTNIQDSIAIFRDPSSNKVGGRYPGGAWLNPSGNTNWHNAYNVMVGPYNAGSTWLGSIYTAKPLWSQSAVTHTVLPQNDSLYLAVGSNVFGASNGSTVFIGSPNCDPQQVGNTWMATGSMIDLSVPASSTAPLSQFRKGYIMKGTMAGTGVVNWSIDSTAFSAAKFYKGSCGYEIATNPRMAFGPDGQTGYAVFIGRLDTTFSNFADSALTPVLFKTIDGGNTWTLMLKGYDWIANHPEVCKNLGKGELGPGGNIQDISSPNNIYSFNCGYAGVDVTVDQNNVLHYVSTVQEAYHGLSGYAYSFDSLNYGGYLYNYDNKNYHQIIWDFMTDGTCWTTMMVDSLKSSECGETASSDTTANFSAWTSSSGNLYIGAHLTVSRTPDGSKIFYGWGDTDPNLNGFVDNAGNPINPNTNPDIWMKGNDIATGKLTRTIDMTVGTQQTGACFFPFLADYSYYDTTQTAWVVPAAFTIGRSFTTVSPGFKQYNGDGTTPATGVNYYYTNCGTFTQAAFDSVPVFNKSLVATPCTVVEGIKTINNAFASSISNYPNPFNNTTTIAVTLTENKPVTIKVYNTIGGLVFTKNIDGNVGTNNVTFDGSQVSSGVYYYTVIAGNEQATKKMVIQK